MAGGALDSDVSVIAVWARETVDPFDEAVVRRLGAKLDREKDAVIPDKTLKVRDFDKGRGVESSRVLVMGVGGRPGTRLPFGSSKIVLSSILSAERSELVVGRDGMIILALCWTGPNGALMTGRFLNGKRGVGRREERCGRSMV